MGAADEKKAPLALNAAADATRFFAATLASRLLQFAYFLVVMRMLSADDRGRYSGTLTLASIAAVVMSLGFEAILVRRIGRDPAAASRVLSAALAVKSLLGLGVFLVMAGIGGLAWWPDAKAPLLALFGFSVFLESLLACYLSFFQARGAFHFNNHIMVWGSLATLAGGVVVAWVGGSVVGFAGVVAGVQFLRLAAGAFLAREEGARGQRPDRREMVTLWRESLPIGLMNFLGLLFVWEDTLVLWFAAGDAALGDYAPVRSLAGHAGLIPIALRTVVFPLFITAAVSEGGALSRLYGRGLQVLLAAALPIAVLGSVFAEPLVRLFFGSTADSLVLPMRILPWMVPFSFLQSLCSWYFYARGKERCLLVPQAALVAVFAAALWFAVERGGRAGACWATLIGTAVNFLVFVPLVLKSEPVAFIRWLWKPLASAAIASATLLLPIPWWVCAAFHVAFYAVLLRVLGVFGNRELRAVMGGVLWWRKA